MLHAFSRMGSSTGLIRVQADALPQPQTQDRSTEGSWSCQNAQQAHWKWFMCTHSACRSACA